MAGEERHSIEVGSETIERRDSPLLEVIEKVKTLISAKSGLQVDSDTSVILYH
jgi:hypothetical protein